MENYISRIANHVYVKGGTEAIKLYKEAFKLGVLWHLCVPKDWNASFIPK